MGSYFAATRVIDATTNTAISSALMDAAEDEILQVFQVRAVSLLSEGYNKDGAGAAWAFNEASTFWANSTVDSGVILFPVTIRPGWVITGVSVYVTGATNSLVGLMRFHYAARGAAPTVVDLTADAGPPANPWDTNGTAYGNVATYTEAGAPFPLTAVAGGIYWISMTAGSNASAEECRIYDVVVTSKMGV